MQVETFECEETATETPEISSEAVALIEKLGLEGQKQLLSPQDDRTERVPYRQMTKDEIFVYSTLCPRKTTLKRFGDEPMPLRVLQVAAHAQSLGIFSDLFVWHRESSAVMDPVLVGTRRVNHEDQTFILARWGEVLEEMPALMRQAMEAWRVKLRGQLSELIASATNRLNALDAQTFEQAVKTREISVYGLD